jgi:hypothetical protein
LYLEKDFFKLRSEFTKQQSHLSGQERYYYRAILENAFNQSSLSNKTIASLKAAFGQGIAVSRQKELWNLQADNYIKLYRYRQAADC